MRAATTRAVARFGEIVAAAQRVFARTGYRRTQVADVARELGVSAGLVYHYFESKEALFHVALESALDPEAAGVPEQLPVRTPKARATLAMVRSHVERWVAAPLVDRALARERVSNPRAELAEIVGTFYDGAERRRLGADLLERSALELPELAGLWFGEVRKAHFENFARYLQRRADEGQLRSFPDPEIAARIIIEIVVFFSRHRHRDPYDKLEDAAVRENVVQFVLAALAGETETGATESNRVTSAS